MHCESSPCHLCYSISHQKWLHLKRQLADQKVSNWLLKPTAIITNASVARWSLSQN